VGRIGDHQGRGQGTATRQPAHRNGHRLHARAGAVSGDHLGPSENPRRRA
jgi:hypothetical protein